MEALMINRKARERSSKGESGIGSGFLAGSGGKLIFEGYFVYTCLIGVNEPFTTSGTRIRSHTAGAHSLKVYV